MTSDNSTACELAKAKRKREENEQRTMEIFKRDNKTVRTPPGTDKAKDGAGVVGKKREEEGVLSATKKDEEDGSLLAVLREIKNKMRDLREEMREMRERMNVLEKGRRKKEEKVEERMDKIEVRLSKIEQRSESITDETTSGKMEEIVGKVAEMENKSLIDTAKTFLEFGARARVKKMRPSGRVGGEIIIVEMDCWEAKDNIMKEKKKLGIYNVGAKKDVEEIMAKITEQCEGCEGEDIIIGGDFNIRIGNLGGGREEEYDFEKESKNKVIENGGGSFVDMINEKGYAQERVLEFRIRDRVDSDHLPLTLLLQEEENTRQMEGCTEEEEEERNMSKKIIVWNEEAKQLYRERTEVWNETEDQEMESVDRKWEKLKNGILGALVYKDIKVKKRRKIGHKDWWDRSCTRKKREVKRKYRRWRCGKGSKKDYLKEKKCLKGWLESKRMEKRMREEEELRKLKDEKKIWNYINSRRKKKEWKENNISKKNWRSYFMELLGRTEMVGREEALEMRAMGTEERNEEQVQDTDKKLQEEEIVRAVRNMKLGKAAGVDGIPMEAWLYGGAAVYAEILKNRLEEIMERKGMIPDSQAGFRKGRSTMDNIFILNHIVQREKEKNAATWKDKIFAIFVDLKAAFDNVDREILWKIMEEKEVERSLINKIKEIYKETEVTIRTKDGFTRCFKTKKGVRQGCVMSPALFNLYIADIDKALENRGIGGVELGVVRVWSLAYADDMVLVAKNREALLDMMSMLKKFLKERKLELSTEKTKVGI
ncbi:trichohyalin-like [Temnothorax curvispinosus]|uniref:Trichohyalin-like n=1 Tax=Temnothorax curvispinosus TaxID=300111 RepID=A0A6J1R9U5_9HYME|nr:trichohyalin-like [Temnothorax curvispinosus]